MALINEDTVNAQFLKGDHIVLAALVIQLVDLDLQALLGFLHLLDGELLRFFSLGFGNAHHNFVDLLLQNGPLALYAHGDLLKLAVPDNDRIVVASGDPTTEFLAVFGLKILAGRNEDVRCRIELQKLGGPLLCQVVRNNEQGFLTKAQPLALHGGSYHFKSLARAHHMGKQGISTVQNVRDGVDLVLAERDLRVDAAEIDMAAIILTGAVGISLRRKCV